MRKNQVNKILLNQVKRRNTVLSFLCVIVFLIFIIVSLLYVYSKKNNEQYVSYVENSDVDYKVYLKQNEFFENDYLEIDRQYISSLIDYIYTKFEYNLKLSEDNIKYKYSYYVEANVEVKDRDTHNPLYNQSDILIDTKEKITTEKSVNLSENLNINFNKYNDLIKKFIEVYDLGYVESVLNINMHINIQSICDNGNSTDEKNSVISVAIPLTKMTTAIDISNNLGDSDNNLLKCYVDNQYKIYLIISIVVAIITIICTYFMFKYISDTRSAETIYERELNKILNNYGTYIQVLGNDFVFNDYQLIKLDSFTDMLEIRDTIRQPILMRKNQENNGAYFVIPSDTKILYIYRLKVSDIEKEISK